MSNSAPKPKKTRKPSFAPNGVPTPPGFEAHPERRHNGAWKKEDTARFKLEKMMKLTEKELKEVFNNPETPLFERKLAQCIVKGEWKQIEGMINQVYGKPKETVDHTTNGESMKTLTVEFLKKKK